MIQYYTNQLNLVFNHINVMHTWNGKKTCTKVVFREKPL